MKKMSLVCCAGCGKEFEKETRYVKSALKKGRQHYCSLSCVGMLNLQRGKEKIVRI